MLKTKNISVIGDGGWGTTLAILLSNKGHNVTLWGAFPEYVETVKVKRVNAKFLPGIKIPQEVNVTSSLNKAIEDKEIIILAVPSQYMRNVLTRITPYKLSGKIFVSVTKGIENKTLKRMSEITHELLGNIEICVLSAFNRARSGARKPYDIGSIFS